MTDPGVPAPPPSKVGFHVRRAQDRDQRELIELAALADGLGYHSVWVSEAWGRDAFVLLARMVDATRTVRLATGIVNVWGRSAGTLAQAAATLDEASGGRVVLGLGVSGPKVARDWHGATWQRPLERLRDVTAAVRLAIAGERVTLSERSIHMADFALAAPRVRDAVPVYWGVYGPASVRAAGAEADGWLAGEVPLEHWPEARAPFENGAAAAGRPAPPVSFMLQLTACDTERERADARELLRRDLAFRLGGLGTLHARALASWGFREAVDRVGALWRGGDRRAATAAVPDALLDAMGCVGSPAEVAAVIERCRAAGVDEPLVTVPRGTPTGRVAATLTACAQSPAARCR